MKIARKKNMSKDASSNVKILTEMAQLVCKQFVLWREGPTELHYTHNKYGMT